MKNKILTTLLLLQSFLGLAQTDDGYNDRTIPTYQVETELARKSMTFTAGFSTTGQANFNAKIDPLLPMGTTVESGVEEEPGGEQNYTNGERNHNYVKTYTAYKDHKVTDANAMDISNSNISIEYFDGLGRAKQSVQLKASPEGRDMVQPVVYNSYGQIEKEYLPYAVQQDDDFAGAFRPKAVEEQKNFYGVLHDEEEFTFVKKDFDNSPLNRIESLTKPGADWQGHSATIGYGTNTETIIYWQVDDNGYISKRNNPYPAGSLIKTTSTDEDNKTTVEYKNLQGQVILTVKSATNTTDKALTYNVYDDLGRLRYVLPPLACDDANIENIGGYYSDTGNDNVIYKLCYYYEYDAKGRLILKKLPGIEHIYMVYDYRDLLVATQDGEQRNRNEWNFTNYDEIGRPVQTGKIIDNTNLTIEDMQGYVGTPHFYFEYNNATHQYEINHSGETNGQAFFSEAASAVYTETYYDNYDHVLSVDYARYTRLTSYGVVASDKTKGLVTATKTLVLEHDEYTVDKNELYTVNYYDDYGRTIFTVVDNHKGGLDRIFNNYNFAGELLGTTQYHNIEGPNGSNTIITKTFEYDRMGRLLSETEELNNSGNILTTNKNGYDETGQLITSKLHKKDDGSFLLENNFKYNIQGWLTHINDPAALGDDVFAMQLKYHGGQSSVYNGNISQIDWNSYNFPDLKTYNYQHDFLNRIKVAEYNGGDFTTYYDEYDLNGNIKRLRRNGVDTDGNQVEIDNLTYTYEGSNQLLKVEDDALKDKGFIDILANPNDYAYNDNGNLTADYNKEIFDIQYNFLNLPQRVVFGSLNSGDHIDYIYNALGIKLQNHTSSVVTDYIGNFVYEDNDLQYIKNSNGRILVENGNYNYEYFIKDQVGNTRVTIDANGTILQEDSYYPFGLQIEGLSYTNPSRTIKNKIKFQGQEEQDELGWYHFKWRMHNPEIGRFMVVDPLAEKYPYFSTYAFSGNRVVDAVELEGKEPATIKRSGNTYELFNHRIEDLDNSTLIGFLPFGSTITPFVNFLFGIESISENDINTYLTGANVAADILDALEVGGKIGKHSFSLIGTGINIYSAVDFYNGARENWEFDEIISREFNIKGSSRAAVIEQYLTSLTLIQKLYESGDLTYEEIGFKDTRELEYNLSSTAYEQIIELENRFMLWGVEPIIENKKEPDMIDLFDPCYDFENE